MTVVCSCAVITCDGGPSCPVALFYAQVSPNGHLNPHVESDAHQLRGEFYAGTGCPDQSRCESCWPAILHELKLVHDSGRCLQTEAVAC